MINDDYQGDITLSYQSYLRSINGAEGAPLKVAPVSVVGPLKVIPSKGSVKEDTDAMGKSRTGPADLWD
jgi:hypothetical protein